MSQVRLKSMIQTLRARETPKLNNGGITGKVFARNGI